MSTLATLLLFWVVVINVYLAAIVLVALVSERNPRTVFRLLALRPWRRVVRSLVRALGWAAQRLQLAVPGVLADELGHPVVRRRDGRVLAYPSEWDEQQREAFGLAATINASKHVDQAVEDALSEPDEPAPDPDQRPPERWAHLPHPDVRCMLPGCPICESPRRLHDDPRCLDLGQRGDHSSCFCTCHGVASTAQHTPDCVLPEDHGGACRDQEALRQVGPPPPDAG